MMVPNQPGGSLISTKFIFPLCLLVALFLWISNKTVFYSFLLSVCCLLAAYFHSFERNCRFQKPPKDLIAFRFQTTSIPVAKSKTYALEGEISAYLTSKGLWQEIRSKSIFYLEKKGPAPQIGDSYLVHAQLQAIRPGAFPYGQNWPVFYARKGIFTTGYLPRKQVKLLQPSHSNFSLLALFDHWQRTLLHHLHRVVLEERNKAVAGAMLLGSHEKIDFETKKSYAALGAIHILSVSGMHIGILFMCLQFFLKFIPKRTRLMQVALFVFPIILIWLYAGITGFSAPVVRASWMFSVVLFAQTFRYPVNSINLLSFTAFIILIWDPMQLFDVGFQLSFLAVLGILLFQPYLNAIWQPTVESPILNYLIKQVISLTTVAIAAQILTFPWILYYFHQFPHIGIMLLANPILVLISSISLVLGMAFLISAPIFQAVGYITCYDVLGALFDYSLHMLHALMYWLDREFEPTIPFLHWDGWMFFPYFLILIWSISWWKTRNLTYLILLPILMLGSVGYFQWEQWKLMKEQSMAYLAQYRGDPVWIHLKGLKAKLVGPSGMYQDPAWIQSNISPLLANHYVQDTVQVTWDSTRNLSWYWKGKHYYWAKNEQGLIPKHVDVFILNGRLKKAHWDELLKYNIESQWLWTQSIPAYYRRPLTSSHNQLALDSVSAQVY